MKVIRRNVFETNSSSTHSLTMCSDNDFLKWEKGETYFIQDSWGIPKSLKEEVKYCDFFDRSRIIETFKAEENGIFNDENLDDYDGSIDCYLAREYGIYSYNEYWDDESLEGFEDSFKTPSGDIVHAFGKYGYDG